MANILRLDKFKIIEKKSKFQLVNWTSPNLACSTPFINSLKRVRNMKKTCQPN